MIEIIQEENWDNSQDRKGLPKDIKQIGTPDAGDRIYIENSAYQKMHPYGQHPEKMVYVLLGSFDDYAGNICIFVEDVVKMNEIEFNGKLPLWNDESWGYLYRKLRPEHEKMIIVGWAVDICGQPIGMTAQLERVHQTYFGGVHQILFLMDTLEREETFFSNRSGYLKRREGFYVYYDKLAPEKLEPAVEIPRTETRKREETFTHETQNVPKREGNYRNYLNRKRQSSRHVPQPTFLLLAVIAALGYSAFQNHQKMKSMEQALNKMELLAVMQTEVEQENIVRVEDVIGNVTPETQNIASMQEDVQAPEVEQESVTSETQVLVTQPEESESEPSETQTLSEAEVYLKQGYYVVQAGDNLAGICRKIYHTTAMMDELCKKNNIKNPDAIFAGQRLTLPN